MVMYGRMGGVGEKIYVALYCKGEAGKEAFLKKR